jgi:bifunctional DNA-binding transcriptional regulator/antitoxin component of YhaV-PrlF toxin-antitoxin module
MPKTKDFVSLRKQGNSLVITIPKPIGQALHWKEGDELFLEVKIIDPHDSFFEQQIEPRVLQISKTKQVDKIGGEKPNDVGHIRTI